jgi:polysaccharide transporter, PST family
MIPFDGSGAFHPVAEGGELRRLAVRGAAATVMAAAAGLAAQLMSTLILARLLLPSDFGVVAMVTTFSMLLMSFGQNGFEELIIQRRELNRSQASNLFWITCGIGFALAIAFAAAGSLLARFYGAPEVRWITFGISPTIFIAATSVVHIALLKRALRFTAVSLNEVVRIVVQTVIAVLLAVAGWGYWALVGGIVASTLSMTAAAWCLCRWIPSLPQRGHGTRGMLSFAVSVYGRFSANYFARNFDNLLIGWQFNATALGFYKKAYDLFALSATQLTSPVANVALAALSPLTQDRIGFKRSLAKTLGIVAFVSMAVGADLTLIGKDVVRLVLGTKWAESGRLFELFGPGIGIMVLYSTVGWIHLSIGRPERWLRWTVVETVITVLLFIVALPWGPAGIALAWTVSYWTLVIPAFWYAGQPIECGLSYFIGFVWRYIVAAAAAVFVCAAIVRRVPILAIAASAAEAFEHAVFKSLLFVVLYLCAVILLHRGVEPLVRVVRLLREMLPAHGLAKRRPGFAATTAGLQASGPRASANEP